MTRQGISIGGAMLAATALALPWSTLLLVAAFGAGSVYLVVGLVREYGCGSHTDPSRCPACGREDLMRVESAATAARIPLLCCRGCGEAFRWWGNTLIRDTGGCQLP
jgi:hypothetical protein